MVKEREIILFGEDLKKPIKVDVGRAEKVSVAVILFGKESAEITADLGERDGALNLVVAHISDDNRSEIRIRVELTGAGTACDIKARSILAGKAKTDLSALIGIRKKANESSANLFAEAMLFGTEAGIDFVPSMEVETKNVTASHGATIETIDPEKNFYLGSRGMNEDEIKIILSEAFLSPLYELIGEKEIEKISDKIKSTLIK